MASRAQNSQVADAARRPSWWRAWLLAARPKTLPAALVPVWLGCVLSWRELGALDLRLAWFTLAGALCIQVATNFFNDAIDHAKGADTAARLGPQRVTASGLLSRRSVHLLALAFLALAVLCGVPLYQARGWPMLAIGIPSLYLAYGYTGGPLPLAYRGLGELFVIGFFGLVATLGSVFVQTGGWPAAAWLLGAQVGLYSAVLIAINNLRDVDEDRGSGKRTLAVRFGIGPARVMIAGFCLLPVVLGAGWVWLGMWPVGLAVVPALLVGLVVLRVLGEPPSSRYNRYLALAGVQLLVFGLAASVALVLAR